MKKSRGQDWMNRHNTQHEIEMKIAASQHRISNQVDRITEKVALMNQRIAKRMANIHSQSGIDALKEQFDLGLTITQYKWTYEYSFLLGRRCFTDGSLILPGRKAYKGKQDHTKMSKNKSGFYVDVNIYPEEIWLTKGEFTMRKLKGQL